MEQQYTHTHMYIYIHIYSFSLNLFFFFPSCLSKYIGIVIKESHVGSNIRNHQEIVLSGVKIFLEILLLRFEVGKSFWAVRISLPPKNLWNFSIVKILSFLY